jgi:hypothetical protein
MKNGQIRPTESLADRRLSDRCDCNDPPAAVLHIIGLYGFSSRPYRDWDSQPAATSMITV